MSLVLIPFEVLLMVLSHLDSFDMFLLTGVNYVDFSQLAGVRACPLFSVSLIRDRMISEIKEYTSKSEDPRIFHGLHRIFLNYFDRIIFKQVKTSLDPGYCYLMLFDFSVRSLVSWCLGYNPRIRELVGLKDFLELLSVMGGARRSVIGTRAVFVGKTENNQIHVSRDRTEGFFKTSGVGFFKYSVGSCSPEDYIGKPLVKVALTTTELEDEIVSLSGGSPEELGRSRDLADEWISSDKVEDLRCKEIGVARRTFEQSCEMRFLSLERSVESVLRLLERSADQSLLPSDSASCTPDKKYPSQSVVPAISTEIHTDFDLAHPGWDAGHYETDLALAVGGCGVSSGVVDGVPDPGSGGLVPKITIDQRLNFLIRLHTALFKMLSEGDNYPGKDFLRKFKILRDGKLPFDHPSLDLLDIVLEDTVDWKRHLVKRNLFKVPGFHPGLLLTERVIGNSLVSLREEYRMRWNSLVGDCVLPSMLSELKWSDDRGELPKLKGRDRRSTDRARRKEESGTQRSKSGWSQLSSL